MDAEFLQRLADDRRARPPRYDRRWHLDADDRRHHGLRQWDPAAIEALVRLAATVESLYPPDWSDPDVVRFRRAGEAPVALAELRTDSPRHLTLELPLPAGTRAADLRRSLGVPVVGLGRPPRRCRITIDHPSTIERPAFTALFLAAVD